MRTVSTGAGLCVLGVCVLGAGALSSPRLGNSATAADGGAPVRPIPQAAVSPQMIFQRGLSRNPDGTGLPLDASVALSSGRTLSGTFQDLEPDIWFTTAHTWDLCVDSSTGYERGIGLLSGSSNDFNGDGQVEYLSAPYLPNGLDVTTRPDTAILTRDLVVADGNSTSFRYQTVMTAAPLLSFIQSQQDLPADWSWQPWINARDMDNDGDIDLVVTLWRQGGPEYMRLWVENTGFQKASPPNPYDLDQDGHVNTADLSLLLMEFTD